MQSNLAVEPADRSRAMLRERYAAVRALTATLAAPLSPEDQNLQSMPDASPAKWHQAHTTWFFETVVLRAHDPAYRVFDPAFAFLFNSYYEALGPRHARPRRGMLSRPDLRTVLAYRAHVDVAMQAFIPAAEAGALALIELGLHHEQQHQELLLTDIKHALSINPTHPAYLPPPPTLATTAPALDWIDHPGGLVEIGSGGGGFAFDNETPRHRVWLEPFRLATRPVSCGEYAEFIADGGYERAEFWLSAGWAAVQQEGWKAPLYWQDGEPGASGDWQAFTLNGLRPVDPAEPVTHLSFYEAAAYAAWTGARLPTEAEWEAVATALGTGDVVSFDPARPHPRAASGPGLRQMFGAVWQWTRSSYEPYPGFRPLPGAVGEYNGKFMVGQLVLRGSSCATPPGHARVSYRNFFPPDARWQFSGIRLARDV